MYGQYAVSIKRVNASNVYVSILQVEVILKLFAIHE